MEPTECSETSAFNIQTPGKYPEDNIPYLQHGKSLKTKKFNVMEVLKKYIISFNKTGSYFNCDTLK
jgi:hypothetical protein